MRNIIERRSWRDIRDSWLEHVPRFASPGAKPDPGLERLGPLQDIRLPESKGRLADVPGLRTNLLWEAVFLFHKCAHAHLASQRLGTMGMHSWSMFNAYHSGFLGARGLMALLGIALPNLPNGGQLFIDVYPQPEPRRSKKSAAPGGSEFEEFIVARLAGSVEHQDLWEMFQRVLRLAEVEVWSSRIRDELTHVRHELISPSRNRFLYRAAFWPSDDLLADGSGERFAALVGTSLDAELEGFLLRLSCDVYRLFEQLIYDLAEVSGPIRNELDESRIVGGPDVPELLSYNTFLAEVEAPAQA